MQSAEHCPLEPAWAGTISFPRHGRLAAFACDEHRPVLEQPVRISAGDRYETELLRRRQAVARAWGQT